VSGKISVAKAFVVFRRHRLPDVKWFPARTVTDTHQQGLVRHSGIETKLVQEGAKAEDWLRCAMTLETGFCVSMRMGWAPIRLIKNIPQRP
jgi:hypothetical protein